MTKQPTDLGEAELVRLIHEYRQWQADNNLLLGSADEHLFDEDLTEAQRDWLKRFCERWEKAS